MAKEPLRRLIEVETEVRRRLAVEENLLAILSTCPNEGDLSSDTHELEEGDTLERLVDAWRAPLGFIHGAVGGGFGGKKSEPIIFCWVPPDGTMKGDVLMGGAMEGFTVESSTGEVRCSCKMYDLTEAQAGRIHDRVVNYYASKTSPATS
jgi:hypothetical protein